MASTYKSKWKLTALGLGCFFVSGMAQAEPLALSGLLADLIQRHPSVKEASANTQRAVEKVGVAKGDYFPTFTFSTKFGGENLTQTDLDQTDPLTTDVSAKIDQLVYDFGATQGKVDKSRLSLESTKIKEEVNRQDLLEDAVVAYIELISTTNSRLCTEVCR